VTGALRIEVWQVPVPLRKPVLTPAGPFDTYYHLVVVLDDGDARGWGYAALAAPAQLEGAAAAAADLLGGRQWSAESLLGLEELTDAGRPEPVDALTRVAVNAIALAAWDLAGRQQEMACADLWGRRGGVTGLDCYTSGFFLDATVDELVAEARAARDAHYRFAKMRVGPDIDDDIARLDAIRPFFPGAGAIAVDAVSCWTPEQALEFIGRAGTDLLWVEDAAPYAELVAVSRGKPGAPLAAGESLTTVAALTDLRTSHGMDDLLLDVQMLGGPSAFLAAARALSALGARIGSHIFTPHSVHLLACVDDPLPVEVFDWSDPLMVQPPQPDAQGRLAVAGPGFGVELDGDALERMASAPPFVVA
jgi:L-alanine-DL-glutamate epimerase-like enolase superfamily enzyme